MKTIFLILISLSACFATAQTVETLINSPTREFESIHWHEDGRIYSADFSFGRVYQIFTDGTVETIVSGFPDIVGGGFDQEGRFYFSAFTQGNLHRINSDGSQTLIASGLNKPVGVLATGDPDILYVIENGINSVSKVTISSGAVETWASGNGIFRPDGIIYHESGDVLVANFGNNKIHRIDSDGNVSLFSTLPAVGLMGYITRVGDFYYVPSFAGSKIYKIDIDGNTELLTGTGSEGSQDGPLDSATFTMPNGIVANAAGDSLLVTDGSRVRLITGFAPIVDRVSDLEINSFLISPNPVNETLNISFELDKKQDLNWKVFGSNGKLILRDNLEDLFIGKNTIQVSVQHLSGGIYTIRFLNKDGEATQYQFVKN